MLKPEVVCEDVVLDLAHPKLIPPRRRLAVHVDHFGMVKLEPVEEHADERIVLAVVLGDATGMTHAIDRRVEPRVPPRHPTAGGLARRRG